jgi:flagellar biosynthesis protein FlhG
MPIIYDKLLMTTVIPVASGKGGVGKTILTANLGVLLARAGKAVVLVDLDLGASNLHTCLGVKNTHLGIGNYVYKQTETLESLLVETTFPRLFLIPGDSLLPGTANLPFFKKQKIVRELSNLVADFVLLDLGAGSNYNTVDFFLTSLTGLIVVTPETTSILNAYSFIKTALFRMLHRSFAPRSRERNVIDEFSAGRLEGSDTTIQRLVTLLGEVSEDARRIAQTKLDAFLPRIVVNMGRHQGDLELGAKLRRIVRRNLGIDIEYIGFIAHDDNIGLSVAKRHPYVDSARESPFARSLGATAARLIHTPVPGTPQLFEDDEDLAEIAEEMVSR